MSVPEIFDRKLRRLVVARSEPGRDFLRPAMSEELEDRLEAVKLRFAQRLDLDASDEDRLSLPNAGFDLIISARGLEGINDLPGVLTRIRRALRPDGLFLGAMLGAPSLIALKAAALAADLATGRGATARVHPQVEVRAAGDLLARVGFALPVADSFTITARYASLTALIADLRRMGLTNLLATRRRPVTRSWLAAAAEAFAARAEPDGKIAERFEIIVMTGWSASAGAPE